MEDESHIEKYPVDMNTVTVREFVRIGKRIEAYESRRRRWKAAAYALGVAASLSVVALVTFSLTRKEFSISPLDRTCNLVADYAHKSSITLQDGTVVTLNAGSSLLYPESFSATNRIVYLNGEGNFTVAKDPSRPFIVKTSYMDVQALGTTFCVHSFPGERVRTTLKEGKVRVSIPSKDGKSYILDPDMQLIYSPSDLSVSMARVDAGRILDWENGTRSFVNASFGEIVSSLERNYGVSISYSSDGLGQKSFNVRFLPDESLDDALDILSLLIPGSRYRKDGNRIYFNL